MEEIPSRTFLRRVIERIPVATYQSERYCTIHIREKLECGHEHIAYPSGDPLIARSRICATCARASIPVELPPKKPPVRSLPFLANDGLRKVGGDL
jgi:hypothetical protein